MKDLEGYKRLPNTETHNCFGCSPINPSGLQMKFFTDDKTVFARVTVPDHLCGWNNVIHGGVLTTMLDESIPLTTGEFDEWGNPKEKKSYDYMLSYSPYDNVEAKEYPNLLVTTGLHDSQVQYFEPAKWVAKLRDMKTDKNKLLLYTNMDTGHGGASGRFDALKEVARDYAFVLDLEGITN